VIEAFLLLESEIGMELCNFLTADGVAKGLKSLMPSLGHQVIIGLLQACLIEGLFYSRKESGHFIRHGECIVHLLAIQTMRFVQFAAQVSKQLHTVLFGRELVYPLDDSETKAVRVKVSTIRDVSIDLVPCH
jgi:hypothetical protein